MAVLSSWLEALGRAIEGRGSLTVSHHRVVQPGGEPLNGSGFVRHQALSPVQRPGCPPEQLALMSFFVPTGLEHGLAQSDLARALGAVITFAVNRRVDVLAETSMSMAGQPNELTFMPLSGLPDRSLLGPLDIDQQGLDEVLREHLTLVAGLDEPDSEIICAALDMHYGACLLLDRDVASAYTLLIAGIEAMSRYFGTPPRSWNDWDQAPRWEDFIEVNHFSDTQAAALREMLMRDKQLRLNETFASYASTTLPESFFDQQWRDWVFNMTMPAGTFDGGTWQDPKPVEELVPRDRAALKRALKRSYVARSGFVHTADRAVNLVTEVAAHTLPDRIERLSFVGLRLVLHALIDHELRTRSSRQASLPELVITLETPLPPATWSTPRPGVRPSRRQGTTHS